MDEEPAGPDPLQNGERYINSEKTPLLSSPAKRRLSFSHVLRGVGTAVCIALVVASWVTMAQSLQGVDNQYHKPFFQGYLIRSSFAILYIVWKLWLVFPGNFACNRVGEGTLTNFKSLFISSAVLAVIGYLSVVFWYLSLTRTSISANTAVYQSVSAIVFVLSVPILRERVSLLKVTSVCMTVTGVTLVSVYGQRGDTSKENSTPLGYVYLALSTLLYASMEVIFKKFFSRADDPAPIQNGIRGVGYLGVHTLLWMWPLLIILHFSGGEPFQLPDLSNLRILLLNALLDNVFNLSLFVCIALSSPLVTTVGSVLVIPASVLVDWLVHRYVLPWPAILGVVIILAGFFALVFSEGFEVLYFRQRKSPAHSAPPSDGAISDGAINEPPAENCCSRRRLLHYII